MNLPERFSELYRQYIPVYISIRSNYDVITLSDAVQRSTNFYLIRRGDKSFGK